MKRTVAAILTILVATAVLGSLVHGVLLAANVADPAATTVSGLTARRLWATTAALVALVGMVSGGMALARPQSSACSGRRGAIVALVAGTFAVVNGVLNVAVATGGPGTGNGVVGGAAALVLGFIAMALGGPALARFRRAGDRLTVRRQ